MSEALVQGGSAAPLPLLRPEWAVPVGITAAMSTRLGGVSAAPFDSLNLRPWHLPGPAQDAPEAIAENQRRFAAAIGARPVWLDQVHGSAVLRLTPDHLAPGAPLPVADASISTEPGVACTVLVADCLPVLFCTNDGLAVGAAHAGWRGLAGGVLEATLAALCAASGRAPGQVQAWLGACIGPQAFEVGADVLAAFGAAEDAAVAACFVARPRPDGSPRWLADLPALARLRLRAAGVVQVSGGHWCTHRDAGRFYSFRREPLTGRLAAAVAISAQA